MAMANPANRWHRHPGTLLSGLAAMGLIGFVALVVRPKPEHPLTLTAGDLASSRGLFVEALAQETASRLVASAGVRESLDAVEAGRVDVALVPGAIRFERWPHLREVAPLFVEPLHLLVKEELYEAVAKDLRMLRGRSLALGAPDNTCH